MVFDNNLYYQNGLYRTTRVIGEFAHNALILQEKGLLEIDEKKKWDPKVPLSADDRSTVEPLMLLLNLIEGIE